MEVKEKKEQEGNRFLGKGEGEKESNWSRKTGKEEFREGRERETGTGGEGGEKKMKGGREEG